MALTNLGPLLALLLAADTSGTGKLPDGAELRQRALTNMRDAAAALERYSCSVQSKLQQVDDKGRIKKEESKSVDRFFVRGVQVDHLLAKDGATLTRGDADKEQRRVDKAVKKFSRPEEAQKVQDRREKQFEMFLRAQRLSNGHRETRGSRSTLVYDLIADPRFKPRSIEERFAQAVGGRVWIDEETGAPVEVKIITTRDVKVGGGLLANVHKGFELHLIRMRQPDGLWMNRVVEGNADLRAGLFFHPRVRFSEETSSCRLFSVDSKDLLHGSNDTN